MQDLLKLCMHVLACDNEENGFICLRIIFYLHKNFWLALEHDVQRFLDFAHKVRLHVNYDVFRGFFSMKQLKVQVR